MQSCQHNTLPSLRHRRNMRLSPHSMQLNPAQRAAQPLNVPRNRRSTRRSKHNRLNVTHNRRSMRLSLRNMLLNRFSAPHNRRNVRHHRRSMRLSRYATRGAAVLQPQRTQQQVQAWQQQRGWLQKGGWQGHDTFQQIAINTGPLTTDPGHSAAVMAVSIYRSSLSTSYFGVDHFFRIGVVPVMYLGYPRFQYRGYSRF